MYQKKPIECYINKIVFKTHRSGPRRPAPVCIRQITESKTGEFRFSRSARQMDGGRVGLPPDAFNKLTISGARSTLCEHGYRNWVYLFLCIV